MIEPHKFRPMLGLPNASPFCMKVEAYLLYRGISDRPVAFSLRKPASKLRVFVVDDRTTITDQALQYPLQDHARILENVTEYCDRMKQITFAKVMP